MLNENMPPSNTNPNFGEIAALQDMFQEMKKRRRSRYPQYVMIVEDESSSQQSYNMLNFRWEMT